jgi:hypothetical protein
MDAWIPILSLIVAALGVVVGPVVTVRIADARNAHEREMAMDERRQHRREDLYVDLVGWAYQAMGTTATAMPYEGEPTPATYEVSEEEGQRLSNRTVAFASSEVRRLLDVVQANDAAFWDAVQSRPASVGDKLSEEDKTAGRQVVEECRQAIVDSALAAVDRIRAELADVVMAP